MAFVQAKLNAYPELQVIEYPGLVKNTDKMLDTLGGINKISQVFGSQHKQLELRYHPKNEFNKPVNGDCVARAGLLLSIKVRRHKRDKSRPPKYAVEIVGFCQRAYVFEKLCDFQFLPLVNPAQNTTVATLFPKEKIFFQNVDHTAFFDITDMPPLIVPVIFARTAEPVHTRILRTEIGANEHGQHNVLGVLQKSTADNRDIIGFNMLDAVPDEAGVQILKRMKVKYVTDEQLQMVKKLFDDCPIWTRIGLLYETKLSRDKMKYILPALTYYYTSGPWRTLHVRYGYDPRKHVSSRIYQTFDYRLRYRLGVAELVSSRKTTLKNRLENANQSSSCSNDIVQDLDYPYLEENKLPRSRQCLFRYCDIRLRKVQEKLANLPSAANSICDEKLGWLPAGFESEVRAIVSDSIKDLLCKYYRSKGQAVDEEMEEFEQLPDNAEQDYLYSDEDAEDEEEQEEEINQTADVDLELEENLLNLLQDIV